MSRFGSLYYTDCRPGQGLQGGAGFQFQAATPGVATEAMPMVQRAALYEPPSAWMRDRRPVTEFPASLAHSFEDGIFATAAGIYLGKEANGTRQGNQFTHAVVTRDPAAYAAERPAQLWGAQGWATGPAAGTQLPELDAPPAGGPLDTETVRDRIAGTSGGEAVLVALLSAVERLSDPELRRTIVLVTADPERAACWVAGATLLLPRPRALRTTFKIFVADPQYGRHDVVALHPEWAGRWADTTAGSGLVVFDLDRVRHSEVEPTEPAAFWVPRFLREDPYDVVDAVEIAGQFAAARDGGVPTRADRDVALLVTTRRPLSGAGQPALAATWLRTAPEEAIRIAREPVLEAVLVGRPGAPVLRELAAAAGDRGWDQATLHTVHGGLLDAELAEIDAEPDGVAALRATTALPVLRLPVRSEDEQRERLQQMAGQLRGAPGDRVPALLALSRRHAVHIPVADFRGAADRCAAWWVDRPEPELAPDRWRPPVELVGAVRSVLRSRLVGPERATAVAAVEDRWWRHLWPDATDPADPLDALLLGTAYARLAGRQRSALVGTVLARCAEARGLSDPAWAAWRILFGPRRPHLPEAVTFTRELDRLGVPMGPQVAADLCAVVEHEREVSDAGLWISSTITQQGHDLSRHVRGLRTEDGRVLMLLERLRRPAAEWEGDDLAGLLREVTPAVLRVRVSLLVDALLEEPVTPRVQVARRIHRALAVLVYKELERRFSDGSGAARDQHRAAAFAFLLTAVRPYDARQGGDFAVLRNKLGVHVGQMSKEDRVAVDRAVHPHLGEDYWGWLREHEPSRIRRGFGRVSDALSLRTGKKED